MSVLSFRTKLSKPKYALLKGQNEIRLTGQASSETLKQIYELTGLSPKYIITLLNRYR